MKKYQVPQIEAIKVENLMQETPGGHSGGDTPTAPARQPVNKQFTV